MNDIMAGYLLNQGGSYGLNIGGAQRKILGVHSPFEPILLGVHNLIIPLKSSIIGGAQAPLAPPLTTSLPIAVLPTLIFYTFS